MQLLTLDNLTLGKLGNPSPQIIQRGRTYYAQGRVIIAEFRGNKAICLVRGRQDTYTVTLGVDKHDRLRASCTCPHAYRVSVCKHMVASLLEVRQYLTENIDLKTHKYY